MDWIKQKKRKILKSCKNWSKNLTLGNYYIFTGKEGYLMSLDKLLTFFWFFVRHVLGFWNIQQVWICKTSTNLEDLHIYPCRLAQYLHNIGMSIFLLGLIFRFLKYLAVLKMKTWTNLIINYYLCRLAKYLHNIGLTRKIPENTKMPDC